MTPKHHAAVRPKLKTSLSTPALGEAGFFPIFAFFGVYKAPESGYVKWRKGA